MSVASLFKYGDEIYKVISPFIKRKIKELGGKPVSKIQADKINKSPSTITNVNQLNPKIRTAAGTKPFKPLPRAAGTRKAGPKAGEVKVKPSTAVTIRKPSAVTARKPSSVAVPKPRPTRPTMRNITPSGSQRALPKAPPSRPSRPIPQGQRVANIGKAGAAAITAATTTKEKSGKPSVSKITPTVPKPRPKTKEGGPGRKFAKPVTKAPSGAGSKRGPFSDMTTRTMPKKFDGSYSKKTQRLVNITIGGKKATYEIPKGMSTKEATSLLKGTAKKRVGGTPGKRSKQRMIKGPSGYKPVKKKNMVTNPEYFKASNRAAEKNVGAKNVPKKVKGFSKLPEKVQMKMNPRLAAKYEVGGLLDSMKGKIKPALMPTIKKQPKPKMDYLQKAKERDTEIKTRKSKGKKLPTKKMKNGKLVGKPVPMPKVPPANPKFKGKPKPMPKMPPLHPEFKAKPAIKKYKKVLLKGGGSVGNGKVARQVKGFGAARKPKK